MCQNRQTLLPKENVFKCRNVLYKGTSIGWASLKKFSVLATVVVLPVSWVRNQQMHSKIGCREQMRNENENKRLKVTMLSPCPLSLWKACYCSSWTVCQTSVKSRLLQRASATGEITVLNSDNLTTPVSIWERSVHFCFPSRTSGSVAFYQDCPWWWLNCARLACGKMDSSKLIESKVEWFLPPDFC